MPLDKTFCLLVCVALAMVLISCDYRVAWHFCFQWKKTCLILSGLGTVWIIPITITILASTPTDDNILFIVSTCCSYCMSCAAWVEWILIGSLFIFHQQKIVLKVITTILFLCVVIIKDFTILMELGCLLKLYRYNYRYRSLVWTALKDTAGEGFDH